jgi:acetoin utilization protein AcuB
VLVYEYMKLNPTTVFPKTTCSDAFRVMLEQDIEKLPVVSEEGVLAGIVTKKDLLCVLPSSAALLSVSEIDNLFGTTAVAIVMTRRVISVSEDCPLEEAARILVENEIGSLPVLRGQRLVGMITNADIFHTMMEALGGEAEGLRITIRLHEDTGELGAITDGIVYLGGKLLSLTTFWGRGASRQTAMLKVQGVDLEELLSLLEKDIGVEVIDHRASRTEYRPEAVLRSVNAEAVTIHDLDAELLQLMDSK